MLASPNARPIALKVCQAVASSWETQDHEQEEQSGSTGMTDGAEDGFDSTFVPRGPGLASILVVFDTLAEACFTSFEEGDKKVLALALGSIWAADGAFRRATRRGSTSAEEGPLVSNVDGVHRERGGTVSNLEHEAIPPSSFPGARSAEAEFQGNASPGRSESSAEGLASDHDNAFGSHKADGDGSTKWVEDSRMVDVVRRLVPRCRLMPTTTTTKNMSSNNHDNDNNTGGEGEGDVDVDMDMDVDIEKTSTGGLGEVDVSMGSEGGIPWRNFSAALLSALDLAEAVLDGVGPVAADVVLAACPQLLESMPPKVHDLMPFIFTPLYSVLPSLTLLSIGSAGGGGK